MPDINDWFTDDRFLNERAVPADAADYAPGPNESISGEKLSKYRQHHGEANPINWSGQLPSFSDNSVDPPQVAAQQNAEISLDDLSEEQLDSLADRIAKKMKEQ